MKLASNSKRSGRPNSNQTPLGQFAVQSGYSLKWIAEKADVSYDVLRQTQKNKNPRLLTPEVAHKIELAFGVSAQWLLGLIPGQAVVYLKYRRPIGTTYNEAATLEDWIERGIRIIDACAEAMGYSLPDDLEVMKIICKIIFLSKTTGASEGFMKTRPHKEAEALRHVSAMHERWAEIVRRNGSKDENGKPTSFRGWLKSFNQRWPEPEGTIKPREDVLTLVEIFLLAAGHHPQSPLVLDRIGQYLVRLEREFDLFNCMKSAPAKVRVRLKELHERQAGRIREMCASAVSEEKKAELLAYFTEMEIYDPHEGEEAFLERLRGLTNLPDERLKELLPANRARRPQSEKAG